MRSHVPKHSNYSDRLCRWIRLKYEFQNFKKKKKKKKKKKSINRYAAFWYQTIVEEKMGEGEEGGKEWSFYKDSFTNLRFN